MTTAGVEEVFFCFGIDFFETFIHGFKIAENLNSQYLYAKIQQNYSILMAPRKNEDGVIDLRSSSSSDEPEFKINRTSDSHQSGGGHLHMQGDAVHGVPSTPLSDRENSTMHASSKVKVKFDKFVNLIATHAYQEIFDKHLDEDVIISTDLLADLANAHEEKDDGKKTPIFIFVGILIGVVITWLVLKSNT